MNCTDLLPRIKPLQMLTFISGIIKAFWGRGNVARNKQISRLAALIFSTSMDCEAIVSESCILSNLDSFSSSSPAVDKIGYVPQF